MRKNESRMCAETLEREKSGRCGLRRGWGGGEKRSLFVYFTTTNIAIDTLYSSWSFNRLSSHAPQ